MKVLVTPLIPQIWKKYGLIGQASGLDTNGTTLLQRQYQRAMRLLGEDRSMARLSVVSLTK